MINQTFKTVLITGCSSGIGECLAIELHKKGYEVIATARNKSKLAQLTKLGITTYSLDVTDQASINELHNNLANQNVSIQAIINNAGYAAMGPITELPMEDLEQQLSTNVTGIVRVVQAFSPEMIKNKNGMIINIGSVSGILTTPFSGAYCASKAAVHCLSDAMRMELSPFNIKVIDVRPGAIESSFGDNAMAGTEKNKQQFKLYESIYEQIVKRSNASQENPTSTNEFVNTLIKGCFTKKPAPVQYIGNGSTVFPLLKRLLPTQILDSVLAKKFGLNNL